MQRVLVTGGAGFIGSHLTDALLARGDAVTVIDDLSTGSRANLSAAAANERLTFLWGTIADEALVRRAIDAADVVFHLAAAVGVELIASDPIRTIETNIGPTALLLDVLRDVYAAGRRVPLFLASTSEVYGKNPKPRWTEEDDLVLGPTSRPRWAYGASKAIDEFLALAHHRQYGLEVVIGRFFNVVGPRQTGRYGMVVPRFVEAALAGGPLVVHDDGRQTRCFAHVDDVVQTVLELMTHSAALGSVFNIGSDEPVAILDLAQRVIAKVDPALRIEFRSYAEAYHSEDFEDVRSRVPDLSRLRSIVRYRPRSTLDEVIDQVIAAQRGQRAAGG